MRLIKASVHNGIQLAHPDVPDDKRCPRFIVADKYYFSGNICSFHSSNSEYRYNFIALQLLSAWNKRVFDTNFEYCNFNNIYAKLRLT